MVSSEGVLTRPVRLRRSWLLPFIGVALVASVVVLDAGNLSGQLVRVIAATVAAWLAVRGCRDTTGRERRVRTWIAISVVVWLGSEVARFGGLLTGEPALLAEYSVLGIAIGAAGTYVSAAHGRMRPVEESALYLDAGAIFFAVAAAVAVLAASVATDSTGVGIMIHAAFFLGLVCATLLLDLSTRVPLRFVGPWEVLAGVALGGIGYVGLLSPGIEQLRPLLHPTVALGVLLVGHGGSHWTADEDDGRRYATIAAWLRGMLPLGSAVLTGVLIVALITQPTLVIGPMRIAVAMALGIVIVCAIARQTLLLADRERVIRHERQLADELTVAEAQYRSAVERVPGVVYVADAGQHGRWHFVSTKIQELLGYTADEWTADPTLWLQSIHPGDRDRMILLEQGDSERLDTKGQRSEYRLIARDGRVVWVIDDEAVISRDADGRPSVVQGILVDISDRKDLEDQLRHQALHDPLTGLPNRVLFVDRVSHALVRRGADDRAIAVLFVDLDDFKGINDSQGHAAGDELLRLAAARLSGVLRAEDTACRLGGDEFAFLLEDAQGTHAEDVAARILAALAIPFELRGHSATLSASIGIAIRAGLGDVIIPAHSADELLRDADTAMYAAKSLGKGRVQVFERGMEEPIARRRELSNALAHAIASDLLFLEYQPIVDMRSGAVLGVEALVRWSHPHLGRLMPADFIGLAESNDLIGPLGDWVMRHSVADLASGTGLLSVNVSAHQLGSGALPLLVEEVLRTTGMPPSRLIMELTESTLASAGAGAETELQRVHDLGVRIALDDFGSGYSSLEYLGRLPVDILKIDRSLVERVHDEPQRQEVLRAIDHIATKLGLETIVEGVELEAQRVVLLELGFRQAQGFLFAPALPLDEVPMISGSLRRAS